MAIPRNETTDSNYHNMGQRMRRLEMLVRNHNDLMSWAEKVSIDSHPPGMDRAAVEEPVMKALRKAAVDIVRDQQTKIRAQIAEEFKIET